MQQRLSHYEYQEKRELLKELEISIHNKVESMFRRLEKGEYIAKDEILSCMLLSIDAISQCHIMAENQFPVGNTKQNAERQKLLMDRIFDYARSQGRFLDLTCLLIESVYRVDVETVNKITAHAVIFPFLQDIMGKIVEMYIANSADKGESVFNNRHSLTHQVLSGNIIDTEVNNTISNMSHNYDAASRKIIWASFTEMIAPHANKVLGIDIDKNINDAAKAFKSLLDYIGKNPTEINKLPRNVYLNVAAEVYQQQQSMKKDALQHANAGQNQKQTTIISL